MPPRVDPATVRFFLSISSVQEIRHLPEYAVSASALAYRWVSPVMSAAFKHTYAEAGGDLSKMAKNATKRIKPSLLQADKECLGALQNVAGYSPVNLRYALTVLESTCDDLDAAQQAEAQAIAAAAAARLNAVSKEWEFHNLMLGAKDQVVAQFGRDSNEAAAVGLKKKSEYKTRARKEPATQAQA